MTEPRVDAHVSAERQAGRDMTIIGIGLIVFGVMAFLGALVVGPGPGHSETAEFVWSIAFYGGVVVVFAGSMVAGFGIRSRRGAHAGLARGCGSAALSIGLGLLLFAAAFGFMFVSCFAALMSNMSKNLK
jgi:hypothetical protein